MLFELALDGGAADDSDGGAGAAGAGGAAKADAACRKGAGHGGEPFSVEVITVSDRSLYSVK